MARDVLFVGGGGHAACLLDCLNHDSESRVVGYVALEQSRLSDEGIEYLGTDREAGALYARGLRFAVLGLAGAESNEPRRAAFEIWRQAGFRFIEARHPSAVISGRATRGEGLQCLAGCIVNPRVTLGDNVIVNTGAIVEHDCHIAHHAHIGPGATLCGGVTVGERALIGAGSVVLPGTRIGAGALIGAGSVVVGPVADGLRVAGAPARPIGGRVAEEISPRDH